MTAGPGLSSAGLTTSSSIVGMGVVKVRFAALTVLS